MKALQQPACVVLLTALAFASAGTLSISSMANACDACLEDKIAATYDWQVVSRLQCHPPRGWEPLIAETMVQYLALRYTEPLADAEVETSV